MSQLSSLAFIGNSLPRRCGIAAFTTDLQQARTSLIERETIDRAKALLMKERNFGEPQAYRWLRRKAMNESKRIVAIAAELLGSGQPEGPQE